MITIEEKRNASASWSGYVHQGKVGFLVALRSLKDCIIKGEKSYLQYELKYENAEDFDITDESGKVLSRHQVKAKKNGIDRSDYNTVFHIQSRKLSENGKEELDQDGFQIHQFDGQGVPIFEEVSEGNRFLHTIVCVPDFYLSKEEYFDCYPNRRKYISNESKVQLYQYSDENNFCKVSCEESDEIRSYCIVEIKEILELQGCLLAFNEVHLKQVYMWYMSTILDHALGEAHIKSSFPSISFEDLTKLITTPIPTDQQYNAKYNISNCWALDREIFEEDSTQDAILIADNIIKEFINLEVEDFENIIRRLNPDKKTSEELSDIVNRDALKNIFFNLIQELEKFDFNTLTYTDEKNLDYRVSLIMTTRQPKFLKKVVRGIVENKEFLADSFDKRYLINHSIEGIKVNNSIYDLSSELELKVDYKQEWVTGVEDNIFSQDMEFIDVVTAISKIRGEAL